MRCRWPGRWLFVVVVALAVPASALAASQRGGLGRIPYSGLPGEFDWQSVIRAQETAETAEACKSPEAGRLVIRHPPIPESYSRSTGKRMACPAEDVVKALRDGRPVELENVVLKGRLNLTEVLAEPVRQADIKFPRGREPDARLQEWLDERRRDHRAADSLAGDTEFRPVTTSLVIRNSWIESIDASAGEPVLFLEPVDLGGSRIEGLTSLGGAIFREPVNLEAVQFLGQASLAGAHFDAGLDLSRARFATTSHFDGATFGTRALSRTRGQGSLRDTTARFTGATFTGAASFRDAVFESAADYQKAQFASDADFGSARFQERADFSHARFGGPLDASHAIFETEARFPGARFDRPASFRQAEFRWRADFGLAVFKDAATTFREARFGPSLFRLWHAARGTVAGPPRWPADSGYDFRHTYFEDRPRALARSEFEIHEAFAVAALFFALVGLLVCRAFQRRRLLHWWPAPAPEVATVTPAPRVSNRASPRQRLVDGAILLLAYAFLAVGLAVHYQSNAEFAVDLWVSVAYPFLGFIVWLGAMLATRATFEGRARRLRAQPARSDPPRPRLDYFDLDYHVPRDCDAFVRGFVIRVSTGMLGLAGARGAGRSSLARAVMEQLSRPSTAVDAEEAAAEPARRRSWRGLGAFLSARFRRACDVAGVIAGPLTRGAPRAEPPAPDAILAATIPGPSSEELLPFFTVLFRCVNEAARDNLRGRLFRFPPPIERESRAERDSRSRLAAELIEAPPRIVFLPLGAIVVAAAWFVAHPWRSPIHPGDAADTALMAALRFAADSAPLLLLASVVGAAAVYYARLMWRTSLRRALHGRRSGLLYLATEPVLERLAFEQSTSDERESSLALPYGLGLRRRQSRALKERPVTLQALLDDFRRYVEELRLEYPRGVVVHIDDADRIDDLKKVRDLLLRLKATLVGGVLYLVPLPDAVLEGTGVRTGEPASSLMGLLDDLAFVPPMSTVEGLRMLARRKFFEREPVAGRAAADEARDGLGLAICVLSGGMPKEILRLLRRVSTEGCGWTAPDLLDRAWQDASDSAAEAVRSAALPTDAQRAILSALQAFVARPRWDAASSARLLDSGGAAPHAPDEATTVRSDIVPMLARLAERRRAIDEVREALGSLRTWEHDMVSDKRLGGEQPWPAPERLEAMRLAFLPRAAVLAGAAEKRASA
jgi:pentapeptide repeat protein